MKTKPILSFYGQQEIKDKFVSRLEAHYKADEIIKGKYWENGKGCDIGCTIHGNSHDDYQNETGIVWQLALVFDGLFEKLPNGQAKEFPLQHTKAMPVGVDTSIIFKKFVIWNLADEKAGLIYHIKGEEEIAFLKEVADTYEKSFTEEIKNEVWRNLADRARSASASASAYASASASAYAYTYAYASTYAYAYAYASTPASAYASAYTSASASASASPEWRAKFDERILQMRDKLLELITNAN